MCVLLSKWFVIHPYKTQETPYIRDIPHITGDIPHLLSGMHPQVGYFSMKRVAELTGPKPHVLTKNVVSSCFLSLFPFNLPNHQHAVKVFHRVGTPNHPSHGPSRCVSRIVEIWQHLAASGIFQWDHAFTSSFSVAFPCCIRLGAFMFKES